MSLTEGQVIERLRSFEDQIRSRNEFELEAHFESIRALVEFVSVDLSETARTLS